MQKNVVQQVEAYVKKVMKDEAAHDFKHVDRVRNWAVQIAGGEGYEDIELVEVTALLHDIGLPYVEERRLHGQKGAEIAGRFLRGKNLMPEEKIKEIINAIRHHSKKRKSSGKLLDILCDADTLDALGAVGIMRAFTSKHHKLEYIPDNIKGESWGRSTKEYDELFRMGLEAGDTIIDQINLQIHYYGNLSTETAKRIGGPLERYMKDFVIQLESEIESGRKHKS